MTEYDELEQALQRKINAVHERVRQSGILNGVSISFTTALAVYCLAAVEAELPDGKLKEKTKQVFDEIKGLWLSLIIFSGEGGESSEHIDEGDSDRWGGSDPGDPANW